VRIAFICSNGIWNPTSMKIGIGGSEEAVMHMGAALAHRGHTVSVHMRNASTRYFGAVEYSGLSRLAGQDLDVVVVWRRPGLLEQLDKLGANAGRRYLWLHDVVAEETLLGWLGRYDKYIVLSAHHESWFPHVGPEHFFRTSNGIDPSEFAPPDPPRQPLQVVYGSDYGRGLRVLLESWPLVCKAVPGAKLNIFYGWQGMERRDPERAAQLKREFGPMMAHDGIRHLGRLSHDEVALQYRRAGVWAYPCCSSRELSCISSMKAQAGGAVPAVIPAGGLRETVRYGFCTRLNLDELDGSGLSRQEIVREWREGLIDLLRFPDKQEVVRAEMVPTCRLQYAWSRVAERWESEFCDNLPIVSSRPLTN
jgi:glycosyltransferase involved in cell wall biosynthesis